MKVSLKNLVHGRTKVLSTVGLLILVGLSASLQNFSQAQNKILGLQDGIQTCFTRVHNSYTARLIGSGTEYLSESFTKNTEECFGEALAVYEDLKISNNEILENLNTLATDVSWFHQKITAKEVNGLFEGNSQDVLLANAGNRFEKLELKKEIVNGELSEKRAQIIAQKATLGYFFYFVAGIVPLILGLDYLNSRKKEELLEKSESAAAELLEKGSFSSVAVRELVLKVLTGFGFKKLAKLYDLSFIRNGDDVEGSIKIKKQSSEEKSKENTISLVPPAGSGKKQDKAGKPILLSGHNRGKNSFEIEKAWTANGEGQSEKKRATTEIESCISEVVDVLASRIFTQGIKVEVNTSSVDVYADKEALSQAIYNILVNAVDNYNFDDPNKHLSISTRKLGNVLIADIYDSGREFSKEFLRQSKGLATGMVEHTELAIAQSLIEDINARISFENVANEDGQQVGRKVQIVLDAVSNAKNSKKLVRLEKMTKKELLRKMNV